MPVSLADVKTHLRLDGTSDDAYCTDLIWCATADIEHYANMDVQRKSWKLLLSNFPTRPHRGKRYADKIILRFPLEDVEYVRYYDANGTLITMPESYYTIVEPYYGNSYLSCNLSDGWPVTYEPERFDNVEISFLTGGVCPPQVYQCILYSIGTLHEQRMSEIEKPTTMSKTYQRLIDNITPPSVP
jgi:hypothetical protein